MKVRELLALNPDAEVLIAVPDVGLHNLSYGARVEAVEAGRPSVPNGHYWERDPRTPTAADQIIILVPASERAPREG